MYPPHQKAQARSKKWISAVPNFFSFFPLFSSLFPPFRRKISSKKRDNRGGERGSILPSHQAKTASPSFFFFAKVEPSSQIWASAEDGRLSRTLLGFFCSPLLSPFFSSRLQNVNSVVLRSGAPTRKRGEFLPIPSLFFPLPLFPLIPSAANEDNYCPSNEGPTAVLRTFSFSFLPSQQTRLIR